MNRDFPAPGKPAWIEQATALLDESARDLDAATLSRLNRARQAALDPHPLRARPWLLPAGLVSACALLLGIAVAIPRHRTDFGQTAAAPAKTASENDALASDASPEFYQDLEFYVWLDAQDEDGGG